MVFIFFKSHVGGKRFAIDANMKQAVTSRHLPTMFFYAAIQWLVLQWKKCLNVVGEYVEIWCAPSAAYLPCIQEARVKFCVLPYFLGTRFIRRDYEAVTAAVLELFYPSRQLYKFLTDLPKAVFFVEVSDQNISSSPSNTVYVLCESIVVKCLQYIFSFYKLSFLIRPYIFLLFLTSASYLTRPSHPICLILWSSKAYL